MNNKVKKLVYSAMLAALVCVATMLIKIPSPLKGYINMGDCVVLISGWLLSPLYGFMAAGIGSALADLFSGYALYAPATLVIKGLMSLIANKMYNRNSKHAALSLVSSGVTAEVTMVLGYYIFEGAVYGFIPSAVNIPFNLVQGIAGVIAGMLLIRVFEKNNIIH